MKLTRTDYTPDGIFGTLTAQSGESWATLEHGYLQESEVPLYMPKLPNGTYTCKRGQHMLHSGPIETFEIENVPGHTGILLHPGNTENASEGCVLLGMHRVGDAITESRVAFGQLMNILSGLDEFNLTVE